MTTRTATKLRPRAEVRWVAERDGVGHAHAKGAVETACGRPVTDPRWAWPAGRRCAACLLVLGELV